MLDEHGDLLGMIVLTGSLKLKSGNITTSVALPTRTIAKALMKLDSVLGVAIFTDIPEEETELATPPSVAYQEVDLPEDTSPVIPKLSSSPSENLSSISKLRAKSEAASKVMINLIARQCLVQGTQESLCHELSVVDGRQTFRVVRKNGTLGKPTDSFPIQKHGVWVQSDWADTLGDIADDPWVVEGSVDDHYLFTLKSSAEDDRCRWEEYSQGTPLFGGGHPTWQGSVDCFEQILTDKDFNVLVVLTELYPPDNCLTESVQTAIYYDWIKLDGLKSPILLPVKERITAQIQGQSALLYTNVAWTDYKRFRVDHRTQF